MSGIVNEIDMTQVIAASLAPVGHMFRGQEAQRTARDLAIARETRLGRDLTSEEFAKAARDAVELTAMTLTILDQKAQALYEERMKKMAESTPPPPPNPGAMSEEEVDEMLRRAYDDMAEESARDIDKLPQ